MTTIELAFPRVKTDEDSLRALKENEQEAAKALLVPNPGVVSAFRGWITHDNSEDVRSLHREILILGERACLESQHILADSRCV